MMVPLTAAQSSNESEAERLAAEQERQRRGPGANRGGSVDGP